MTIAKNQSKQSYDLGIITVLIAVPLIIAVCALAVQSPMGPDELATFIAIPP